jgi:hypothetical protein
MFDRPIILCYLMMGWSVLYLALPFLVIFMAVTEVGIINSAKRPRWNASNIASNSIIQYWLRLDIIPLSVRLKRLQHHFDSASTAILHSNLFTSTIPQHRKTRRKRRNAVSYSYLRYLAVAHALQVTSARGRSPLSKLRPHPSTALWTNTVQFSSMATPSDLLESITSSYVSEGDPEASEGGKIVSTRRHPCSLPVPEEARGPVWDPLALLSSVSQSCYQSATCFTATHRPYPSPPAGSTFDTDSASVGIDNRCSVCMSHVKSDFNGALQETTVTVTGFHGTKDCQVYRSTIKWRLEIIPGSYSNGQAPTYQASTLGTKCKGKGDLHHLPQQGYSQMERWSSNQNRTNRLSECVHV